MILICTSRRPTNRIRSFSRDLNRVVPHCVFINRGKQNLKGVMDAARNKKAEKVIMVERWKGGVGKLCFYSITSKFFQVTPPQLILRSVKTQAEFGQKMKIRQKIGFLMPNSASKVEEKLVHFLARFFQIPIRSKDIIGANFAAAISLISLPQGEIKLTFTSPPLVNEVGPRMNIKKILWQL